jgi:AcrR family transcriptional regulator
VVPDGSGEPFLAHPSNTREAVLRATYEVLCEHGYDGVSMSRIAARADVSKSVLYHHYDGKDDLLQELFDATLAAFLAGSLPPDDGENDGFPRALSVALSDPFPGDTEESSSLVTAAFLGAYVALRARASHDSQYRATVTRVETHLRREFAPNDGRDGHDGHDGSDPRMPGVEWHLTLVQGLFFRRATADDADLDAVRAAFERHVENDSRHET